MVGEGGEQECKDFFFPDCSELTEAPFFDVIVSKRGNRAFYAKGEAWLCSALRLTPIG